MSSMIDQANAFLQLVLVGVVFFAIVFFAFLFIYKKKRKGRGLQEDGTDYSGLERKDSEDYMKFDDIKDGMIICDNGYRFVAAIRCYGNDFYHAPIEMQALIARNFEGYVNTITRPITYRQYSRAVDMEYTLQRYQKAYSELNMELYGVTEDIRVVQQALLTNEDKMSQEEVELYHKRIEELKRKKASIEWRDAHIRDEMAYIRRSSGNGVAPEQEQTWIFDWTFDTTQFTVELSKEQIYERAVRELNSIARTKIHALQNCRVRAVRCTTEDLIEMTRRYSSPISADRFKMRDVIESSFFDDINVSRDIDELVEEGKRSILQQQEGYMKKGMTETLFDMLDQLELEQENETEEEVVVETPTAALEKPAETPKAESNPAVYSGIPTAVPEDIKSAFLSSDDTQDSATEPEVDEDVFVFDQGVN